MNSESRSQAAAIERKKVGMLIPPPVLLVLTALTAILVQALALGGVHLETANVWPGIAVAIAGFLLLLWCSRSFRAAGTPVRPVKPTTVIVTTGPYALSRNPMYVGMAVVMAGFAWMSSSVPLVVAMLVFLVIVHFGVVVPEEHYLLDLHGDAYRRYTQIVRRWL